MGYILYSSNEDSQQRRKLKTYKTAEEAAEDLGITRQDVVRLAAYCRFHWDHLNVSRWRVQRVILSTGDNRQQNGSSTLKKAYDLISHGIDDPAILAEKLGISITTARKHLYQYRDEHEIIVEADPKNPDKDSNYFKQFAEEWDKARFAILLGKKKKKREKAWSEYL